jgi:hypothetical protein
MGMLTKGDDDDEHFAINKDMQWNGIRRRVRRW